MTPEQELLVRAATLAIDMPCLNKVKLDQLLSARTALAVQNQSYINCVHTLYAIAGTYWWQLPAGTRGIAAEVLGKALGVELNYVEPSVGVRMEFKEVSLWKRFWRGLKLWIK